MSEAIDPLITRAAAAALISSEVFFVKERELRRWSDVPIVYVAGRAQARRSLWLKAANDRLAQAVGTPPKNRDTSAARAKRATT